MLDITGAGTQLPMRSHWKLRPGPQSHKNSEQQCKRYRAKTHTANSKASAAKQAAQQPQPAPLSHCLGAWPWDLSTNKADHWNNVHILINAQNAVIATRVPVVAVDYGRLLRGRRACVCFCAYVTCGITKTAQCQ
jgi:hypothetical protein